MVSTLSGVTRRPLAPHAKRPLAHRELSELLTADPFHTAITFKHSPPHAAPMHTRTHTHILDLIKHDHNARIYCTCTVSTFFGVTWRPLTQTKKRPLAHSGLFESHYADPVQPPPFNHVFFSQTAAKKKSIRSCSDSQKSKKKEGEIPKDMPPKFTERIYQDVAYLIQPLQIILYNWQSLSVIYDRLKAARQLDQLVSQALPIIL